MVQRPVFPFLILFCFIHRPILDRRGAGVPWAPSHGRKNSRVSSAKHELILAMTKVLLKAISTIRYSARALGRNMRHSYGSAYRFWHQVRIFTAAGDDKGYGFRYIVPDILTTVITLRKEKKVLIACECGRAKLSL